MNLINNVLKAISFFSIICRILFLVVASLYLSTDRNLHMEVIGAMGLAILDTFMTYLFFKNTILNENNSFKIVILSIFSILIGGILYINQCSSINVVFSIQFFKFYCLPVLLLLISITFNNFYIKKALK